MSALAVNGGRAMLDFLAVEHDGVKPSLNLIIKLAFRPPLSLACFPRLFLNGLYALYLNSLHRTMFALLHASHLGQA